MRRGSLENQLFHQLFLAMLFFSSFLSRHRHHSFSSPGRAFTGTKQCKFTPVNNADLQEL